MKVAEGEEEAQACYCGIVGARRLQGSIIMCNDIALSYCCAF